LDLHSWQQDQNKTTAPPAAANFKPHELSPELENLFKDAWGLHVKHQEDAARERLGQALTLAREQKNVWAEGEAHRLLGLVAIQAANYPGAQSELEQALSLFEKAGSPGGIARAHQHLGAVASYMGNPQEAAELYRKALSEFEELHDLANQAQVLQNLGALDGLPADERYAYLEQGLGLAKQIGNKVVEGQILHSMGDGLFARGDYAGAIEKLNEAATALQESGDRGGLATVWTSLGRLYRAHGAYDEAISSYKKGLSIQQELGDRFGVIQSLNAMAISYGLAGHDAESMENYERALRLARETGSPRVIAFIAGNLAGAYNEQKQYKRAIELLEESLRLDPTSIYVGNRYIELASACEGLKQYDKALENANKAVELTRQRSDPEILVTALQGRAKVYMDLREYSEALADIQSGIDAVEQLRAKLVPADYLKQGYANATQELFANAIELHEKLGRSKEAMVVAEQARARAFLDLLTNRALTQASTPSSASTAGESTPQKLSASSEGPAAAKEPGTKALTTRGANPLNLGESVHGAPMLSSRASAAPPTFEEVLTTAKRLDSTLLSYWVTPDATFVWVLKQDGGVSSERIAVSSEQLVKLIRAACGEEDESSGQSAVSANQAKTGTNLHATSATRGAQALRLRGGGEVVLGGSREQSWRQLYKLLILPIQKSLPAPGSRLTIVPQGPLFRLSFAALQDAQGHYLVENYSLNYAPSLGVLRLTGERKKQLGQREPRYLIVADPQIAADLAKDPGLPPLPGAREEARTLERLLPRSETTVLIGADADKTTVREDTRGKTVVHLATHAIVRDDQPFDSYLVLSAGDKSPPGSGRLTVQEIYGMDLEADLVVLSACRTALGKVSGDGMVGMTRAFFYGGAPSVMATLWDVADEPTSVLISDFYKSLQKDPDKSRALRLAQLRLIRQLRSGRFKVKTPLGPITLPEDPVFWAGFVLQGEP
jgi:CHAT domain-containing protein/tetratricopeptide (TPR) repeat protein